MLNEYFITPKDLFRACCPLLILLIFIITGAYVHATTRQPYLPKHYLIASSVEINGKGQLHQCFPYAQELRRQLYFEANLLSSMIFFNWFDDKGEYGSHVVVHYWDRYGNQWIVDNQIPHPVSVYGETTEEMIAEVYPELRMEVVPTLAESL